MSTQYPGGIISKTPVTPSGPYETSTASGVWTLDQQAYWQKLGQWPSAGNPPPDAQFNYVTMLLHGDGTNGAQNNTFLDSSTNNYTITRSGNTTQGSLSPYGSNWSNYFTGKTPTAYTSLSITDSTPLQLGSSDFTIECWVQPTGANDDAVIVGKGTVFASYGDWCFYTSSNTVAFYGQSTSAWDFGSVNIGTTPIGQWSHIAVTRSGSSLRSFLNGVLIATATVSGSIANNGRQTTIGGGLTASQGGSRDVSWNGYISNLRIVKGTAVYTSAFTPSTTPLTAVSGTSLLTCQSNRFVDNSGNNLVLTANGTPSVQRFNPFGASTAYSTSVIGGSGYFDGSGDYLTTTWSTIGANQFTCEAWVYMFDNSNRYYIVGPGTDTASHFDGFGFEIFNGYLSMWASSNGTGWNLVTSDTSQGRSANVLPLNAWTHVVMTRDSSGVFRSFINGNLQCTVSPGTAALADSGTTVLNIGRARYTGDFANFYGYMSNLRIVNGSVVTAYSTSSTTVGTQIFTPPTAPVTAITNTSLLANFTNGAIFDNAMMNDLETVGNAQISTSVVKYGTGSLYFDAAGSYLVTANSPNVTLGSGNWTMECWIYSTDPGGVKTITAKGFPTSGGFLWWVQSGDLRIRLYDTSGGQVNIAATAVISANTWYHVAVVRSSNTVTMYVNGTSVASGTYTSALTSTSNFEIGAYNAGTGNFQGYIDDLRITKGYARYTTTFTPPTAAFPNIGPT